VMPPIDQDARERVELGLGESLLVEAGAGTGKTTALVARVANVLRSGHATVDDLAVVTFTKDAAAELVSRVRERLEDDLAADPPPSEAERRRLDEALRGLYRARIATLHVFAGQLLRERPVEARVDPGLRILSGLEREQLFNQHYSPWLDEVLMANDPDLRLALNRGLQLKHLE
jgi:ATP-dependent helicase/nuclease subunit A